MTLELPFAYTFYITPHFWTHEPHLHILALESKMRDQEWEFTCDFWEKRRFCSHFQDFFISSKFVKCENFSKYENLNFSHHSQNTKIFFTKLQTFLSSNPMRQTFSLWIVKTSFQSNLMKYISRSNGTYLFMIQNENPFIWSQVHFFSF